MNNSTSDPSFWLCPKCGQHFQHVNQNHSCIEITTIDQYIDAQTENFQPLLRQIRMEIRNAAPNAKEKISWKMPTFWQGENLIHFAAAKKHIGIYPGEEAVKVFADRIAEYKTSKGTIQLPLERPIDYKLIADITRWRVQQVEGKRK